MSNESPMLVKRAARRAAKKNCSSSFVKIRKVTASLRPDKVKKVAGSSTIAEPETWEFVISSSKYIICKSVVLYGRGRGVNNKWTIVDCSTHVQGGVCPQPHCLGPVNSGHVRRGGGRPRPDIGCPRPLDTTHKVHRCVYYTFR